MKTPKLAAAVLLCALGSGSSAPAQLIYNAISGQSEGIFLEQAGQISQIQTGFAEHRFPTLSRDGRFFVFSSPDPVTVGGGPPPSGDIYVHDRSTGQTVRAINLQTIGTTVSTTFVPISAALSPDGRSIAYGVELTNRIGLSPDGSGRNLLIADAATGVDYSEPTADQGGAIPDGYQGACVGISWAADSQSFVTPSYFPVYADNGTVVSGLGILRFARDPATGKFFRQAPLSSPRYINTQIVPGGTLQIYPALSPDGTRLAYFDLYYPDILANTQPVTCVLVVANADGSAARGLVSFAPGKFPIGVAWAPGGQDLVFSIADQLTAFGQYTRSANGPTGVLRVVGTAQGSTPRTIAGVSGGYFPNFPATTTPVSTTDMAKVPLALTPNGTSGFILRATGLNPSANYRLESTTTLGSFPTSQDFTGSVIMNGISIPRNLPSKFFRLRRL